MVLTEGSVKVQLPKVRQQLNPSALHHVLTEVHHAVQVVEVSCLGVSVPLTIHWETKTNKIDINLQDYEMMFSI